MEPFQLARIQAIRARAAARTLEVTSLESKISDEDFKRLLRGVLMQLGDVETMFLLPAEQEQPRTCLDPSNWLDGAERYLGLVSALASGVEEIVSKYGCDFVTVDPNGW